MLFVLILGTLLYRLMSSFSHSVYALSSVTKWVLIILYVVVCLLSIWVMIEQGIIGTKYDGNWNMAAIDSYWLNGWTGTAALILYIIVTIYAVFLFIRKLIQVTQSQMQSHHDVTKPQLQLSPSQKKILGNAAKYVSLLSLAIFTSILTSIGWMLSSFLWDVEENYGTTNSYLEESMVLLTNFVAVVNLICLYLQFSFATKLYQKYCCGLQNCWHHILYSKVVNSATPKKNQFTKVDTVQSEDEC